jgi:hypothetical protein
MLNQVLMIATPLEMSQAPNRIDDICLNLGWRGMSMRNFDYTHVKTRTRGSALLGHPHTLYIESKCTYDSPLFARRYG